MCRTRTHRRHLKVKVGFTESAALTCTSITPARLHTHQPHPLTGRTLPLTIGQEFSGVITGVGAAVTGYPRAIGSPCRVRRGRVGARGQAALAGWRPRYRPRWPSVGARKPTISVAIYEKPLVTPLLNLVMNESRVQGSLCYTSADFEAVIALMAQGGYDTTGWVTPISIDDVVDEGFEALHAGAKMRCSSTRRAEPSWRRDVTGSTIE